eukprot:GHVU01219038.1.p1 GENE.GHVU01219038.1~~GHVU01219038.1.p1  ORF type:complete len:152 (-),score=41.99 GHVU01219038.1:261-716(-)
MHPVHVHVHVLVCACVCVYSSSSLASSRLLSPPPSALVPQNLPKKLRFYDEDKREGRVGGALQIFAASSEADFSHYGVYLGDPRRGRVKLLGYVPKQRKRDLLFEVPAGTLLEGCSEFHVVAVGDQGESVQARQEAVDDHIGETEEEEEVD